MGGEVLAAPPQVVSDPLCQLQPEGDLPGEIDRLPASELASVSVTGARLLARPLAPLTGRSVRLLVRPAAVELLPPAHEQASLGGIVRDVAFRGHGYDHVIEIPGGYQLAGAFSIQRWERGQHIGVRLDPSGCLIFSGDRHSRETTVNLSSEVPVRS